MSPPLRVRISRPRVRISPSAVLVSEERSDRGETAFVASVRRIVPSGIPEHQEEDLQRDPVPFFSREILEAAIPERVFQLIEVTLSLWPVDEFLDELLEVQRAARKTGGRSDTSADDHIRASEIEVRIASIPDAGDAHARAIRVVRSGAQIECTPCQDL